ncbi:hypothetical protein GUITHDRAFT_142584 [Guillardia theta CCMP2712]|uniref:Nucleotide-diphospho-sugar transferase domain-containing protein n=2 Tax=Guillardia theta TaxID=55529 RepID=L1IXW4_GUITC|nr:hypothetical protein GUITHDRAFT_142584 [Guillardia theta CCMP2712]EKX40719.1 hypothetical protein GUITHDRAFT_142584 [Guillardia theta CCMP2712]|mmetsp:Transcript_30703/g.98769  ORF Transcript_30703/g.98769 Transcript_30703/m.98769 type:complete len:447 (+) Transcript_30703:85-1425(+)|eukprot:XP_005827699.1 hypothetical protein GUITHDRAFT_142584 [Guillardia theta CCMP2712]
MSPQWAVTSRLPLLFLFLFILSSTQWLSLPELRPLWQKFPEEPQPSLLSREEQTMRSGLTAARTRLQQERIDSVRAPTAGAFLPVRQAHLRDSQGVANSSSDALAGQVALSPTVSNPPLLKRVLQEVNRSSDSPASPAVTVGNHSLQPLQAAAEPRALPPLASERFAIVTLLAVLETQRTKYAVLACLLADSINKYRSEWKKQRKNIDLVLLAKSDPSFDRFSGFFERHGFIVNKVPTIIPRWGVDTIDPVYKDQFMKFWALKMTQYSKILFVDADSVFYKDPAPLFLKLQHFTGCQANGIKAWVGAARCLNGALLFFKPSEELFRRHVEQQQVIPSTCRHSWMDVTEMGPLNAQNSAWMRPQPDKLDAGLCFDPYAYSVRLPPLYTDFNLEEDMILMHGMKYTNLDELAEEKWFVGPGMRTKVLLPFRAEFERKDELWASYKRLH